MYNTIHSTCCTIKNFVPRKILTYVFFSLSRNVFGKVLTGTVADSKVVVGVRLNPPPPFETYSFPFNSMENFQEKITKNIKLSGKFTNLTPL